MRVYLDTVIKADQCAQYVDDIGIAANAPEQLIKKISYKVYQNSRCKTYNRKMPFWGHPSGIPSQIHHP